MTMQLSSQQPIPAWARLTGRRQAGESEFHYALQSRQGQAHPWAVPVELVDGGEVVTDAELYHEVQRRIWAQGGDQ